VASVITGSQKPIALVAAMASGGMLGVAGESAALDGPKILGIAIFVGTGSVFVLWKIVSWWLDGVSRTWNAIPRQFETLDQKLDGLSSQLSMHATQLSMHMVKTTQYRRAREEREREVDRRLTAIEQRCVAFTPKHRDPA
jgi:hypothetical protein